MKNQCVSFAHSHEEIQETLNSIAIESTGADEEQLLFLLERLNVLSSKMRIYSNCIYRVYEAHICFIREQIMGKISE
ncbi:hypothetical protein HY992_05150 [Candidatus Micrarchaeota archaeon]|nr:hypothetical protein [Candidatus Micrarchaeota archaeon]